MSYGHRHDQSIALIRQELPRMTSDDERTRARAVATIAQAAHTAMLAEPLAADTAARVYDPKGRGPVTPVARQRQHQK